jgi:hypothetical protein
MSAAQPLTETAAASSTGLSPGPARNADFDWDDFGALEYHTHNYTPMREDDAQILDLVHRWFASCAEDGRTLSGLDVGAGPNLYPALAMLPFCADLTLHEYSADNVGWLREQTADASYSWKPFWEVISPRDQAGSFDQARGWLAERARVEQGSIFELPRARWDIGTMFFVAESLTEDREEFGRAVECFVGALRPGAPFAAAFMELSQGYDVGERSFPACPVDHAGIRESLNGACTELTIHQIEIRPAPLRPGYEGMVVAIGRAK